MTLLFLKKLLYTHTFQADINYIKYDNSKHPSIALLY